MNVLTGTDLEIGRRLDAGQTVDRITEAGWWYGTRTRPAWTRADVIRVGWAQTFGYDEERGKPGPKPQPAPGDGGIPLSPRLQQMCEFLLCGYTVDEMAARMGVTARTAARYQQQLASVLGVPTADIAWAIETGRVTVSGVAA